MAPSTSLAALGSTAATAKPPAATMDATDRAVASMPSASPSAASSLGAMAATRASSAADAKTGAAIASFYAGYTAHVKGPNGSIDVPAPFRMVQGENGKTDYAAKWGALAKAVGYRGNEDKATAQIIGSVVAGRCTPAQYRQCVELLAKRHPEKFETTDGARAYLEDLGVGVDCAGSVQMCLRQTLGDKAFERLGLRTLTNEDLSGLASNKHFARVGSPADARPGDVMTLAPPGGGVGHAVIVQSKRTRLADADDVARAQAHGITLHAGDPITSLDVTSSWGGVGPATRTFMQLGDPGTWAMGSESSYEVSSEGAAGPYNHTLVGIFRPKAGS
jgi:hypothetical protein